MGAEFGISYIVGSNSYSRSADFLIVSGGDLGVIFTMSADTILKNLLVRNHWTASDSWGQVIPSEILTAPSTNRYYSMTREPRSSK